MEWVEKNQRMTKESYRIIHRSYSTSKKKPTYARVPNTRTGRLLENEKKSHLYALIWNSTIINFQQKVPPIRLFPPIFS